MIHLLNFLKNCFKEIFFYFPFSERLSISNIIRNKKTSSLIVRLDGHDLRESLFLPSSNESPQLNQDIFALLVNKFKPGYFVEVGANDGFNLSNTIYLEEKFDWKGLLIEANPKYQKKLMKRNAHVCISAVSKKDEILEFRDAGLYGGLEEFLDTSHTEKREQEEIINISEV